MVCTRPRSRSSITAGSNRVGIFANGDITITDSTVKASGGTDESSGDRCTAIYTPNTLTIDGASKVTANGDYRGIQGNTVTIGGNAEVNVTGQDEALVSFDVGISGDSVVKATSVNSSAITGKTSLSITQNADVVATGAVCAILAEDTLVLSAKNIEAYSTSHYAIFNIGVGKNITIGGKLEAQSTNVYAIRSYGNIITDNQADIKAAGGWGGIHADGNITFNGSKIEAIGNDDDGIYSTGTISINGGSVHAKGANGYAAIRAKNIRTAEEAAVSKITVTNLVEKNGGKVAFCDWFSHASGGTGSWTTFIGKDETALVTNSGGGITNGLTEVWLAAPYIVTFDVNGGSGENSTVQVYPGNKVTAPTTEPAKDGRHFSGWYLDETEFDFVNTTITKAITLKAKFDVHAPNADDGDCTTPITCSVCGEITTPAKTAHTWGAGEVTTPATHTADGMKTLTCTVCVQVKTEVIPATGHTWSTEWSKDASNHWHKCAANDGGIKDTGAHTPGEGATIEHPQLCTICGYEITPKLPSKDAAEDNATGIKVEYENGSPFDSRITLRVISKPQAEMDQFQEAVDKAAPGLVLGGLYDISFFKDGVEIQPDDQIKVSIPLVEPMKTMTDLQIVYIDDNGKTAIIPSTVADDKITFITDHFSNYGIIGKVEADNSDASDGAPSTGENSPILPIVLVAFASGTALIILGQKRKFKLIKK